MSNSGSFKLLQNENTSLKKTLVETQNILESFRSKYHESDKQNAVLVSKRGIIIFHEILKFTVSTIGGGIGVNLLSNKEYQSGLIVCAVSLIIYALIVFVDNKK